MFAGRLEKSFLPVLRSRFKRHGLLVALNHFEQAERAYLRRDLEAGNAQARSFVEALFDAVAATRLGTSKTAGTARRALQDAGLLSDREGKYVQAFMDLAGSAGSHAGASSPDEAYSRRLGSFSIAFIALSLLPDLVRAQDVFRLAKIDAHGDPLQDGEMWTTCPTCQAEQNLYEASVARDHDETIYSCKNGCQAIVVVGAPGKIAIPDRGFRLGSYVIRNAKDLFIRRVGWRGPVLLPASRTALIKIGPTKPAG